MSLATCQGEGFGGMERIASTSGISFQSGMSFSGERIVSRRSGRPSLIARIAGTAMQASPSQFGERTMILKGWRSVGFISGGR